MGRAAGLVPLVERCAERFSISISILLGILVLLKIARVVYLELKV